MTDDGTKRSKKGLLKVFATENDGDEQYSIICIDQQTWERENEGLLTTVFKDGKLVKQTTLQEIRDRLS